MNSDIFQAAGGPARNTPQEIFPDKNHFFALENKKALQTIVPAPGPYGGKDFWFWSWRS